MIRLCFFVLLLSFVILPETLAEIFNENQNINSNSVDSYPLMDRLLSRHWDNLPIEDSAAETNSIANDNSNSEMMIKFDPPPLSSKFNPQSVESELAGNKYLPHRKHSELLRRLRLKVSGFRPFSKTPTSSRDGGMVIIRSEGHADCGANCRTNCGSKCSDGEVGLNGGK